MLVYSKNSFNQNVFSVKNKFALKINNLIVKIINFLLVKIFKQQSVYSLNLSPSRLSEIINKSEYDIINFHWINHEMISLSDIMKISKPIVWTLHDNWPFSSIEHYIKKNDNRYIVGYNKKNSSVLEKIFWKRKLKVFEKKISVVIAPSKWIANLAKESFIFKKQKNLSCTLSIRHGSFFFRELFSSKKKIKIRIHKKKY